jgi:secretion/DNA translocation related TadE-like protein
VAAAVNRRDSSQRGSATVLVLGVCLVAFALIAAGAGLGSALVARHRAESVADLASLAAADVLMGRAAGAPCDAARRVAGSSGPGDVVVVACRTHGRVAQVSVVARPSGWVGALGAATVSVSAGPAVRPTRP